MTDIDTREENDTAQLVDAWLATYADASADAAWLLCDRHPAERIAFTFVGPDLTGTDLTFGELSERSRRLASLLRARGVGAGDRVAVLMGKRPGLIVTLLALWRLGAVHVPLFTAFAHGAIAVRVEGSGARLLVTEASQRTKVEGIAGLDVLEIEGIEASLAGVEPLVDRVAVGGDGQLIEIFTSGTTGNPKGVPVPLRMLAAAESYLRFSLDLRAEDVYWNAADPGWAYGLYYALLGPLAAGRRALLSTAPFSAAHTLEVMRAFGVTNFAGAPTMYRALRAVGVPGRLRLRRASSAGEPLDPDLTEFGREVLGVGIRDHYGQTELGMVLCDHWHPSIARDPVPGSMGRPLPGFALGIVDGQIAVDTGNSPLAWFSGYVGDPRLSRDRFTPDGRWYLTSDLGRRDDDGNFFFRSRSDDVILAAGYRIGPTDVENVLLRHPAVREAAVVGRPDPDGVRGEQVEAFVVVADGVTADDELADALARHVRDTYSKHAYPRRVHFVGELPKTPSGKLRRYVLRQASVD
ncbi:AMP-binding protein [Streptomyces palmae]|uniref:AMP-dependent synthetase n=1 Tax=Streptomyces palmae TaxID=1701085 RepID=A0A4Z0HFK3_9ACTN|nr:AMP-binding protein [Streptomyces palmae]TGB18989.1 AMP-dependent synthetase [Streptomyces palmae]